MQPPSSTHPQTAAPDFASHHRHSALSVAQNLYRLFDEVPFAVAVLMGEDLTIDFINRYNLDIWQCSREEVLGRPLFDVFPGNREGAEPIHKEIYRTGKRFTANDLPIELMVNGKREMRWFNTVIDPLRNDEGAIVGQLATTMEVTDQVLARKKVEAAKEMTGESEKMLSLLSNAAPALIFYMDAQRRYRTVNETFGKWFDVNPGDVIGQTVESFVGPEAWAVIGPQLEKAYGGQTVDFETVVSYRRGGTRCIHAIYTPHQAESGEVLGVMAFVTDITAQKAAEEQLRYTATLTQNIADAVIGTDSQYRISSWNKGAEELYGYATEDVLGKPTQNVVQTEFLNRQDREAWQQELETEGHWKGEVVQRRKDGSAVPVLSSIAYIRNQKGEAVGAVAVNRDITAQKNAEQAVRKSEEEFRTISNAIPQLVWVCNTDGEVVHFNDKWYEFTGTGPAESLGHGWASLVYPDDVPGTLENWNRAQQTASTVAVEYRLRTAGGDYRWVFSKGSPIKDKEGRVERWFGTCTDIHERKEAERALKESEGRFRTLAEALPQMVWMRNLNGEIEYASGEWKDYSGIENISDAWRWMVHPDDWGPIMATWESEYATGHPFRYEVRLKNKNGEYRWHYAVAEPVRDASGAITKWIGALTDIHVQKTFSEKLEAEVRQRTTELTKTNERLAEKNLDLENTRSFLQQLIDSSVEFISVLDKDLRIMAANKKFEAGMGLTKEELVGQSLFDVNPHLKDTVQLESIYKALAGETVYLDKRRSVARPDFYVDTYFVPLLVQAKPEGVIIMSRDVTEIVRSEKLLEEKNKELYRSNEDLQQFAHVASHDLKEPVRKIRTFGSRLREEFEHLLPDKARLYVEKMENAAERMYAMIEGVLLYSTLNAVQQPAEKVDLTETLKTIENDLEVPIQQKAAAIEYAPLPVVEGSPILLYQLFYNLVNNSLKFTKPGVPPSINITSSVKSNALDEAGATDRSAVAEIVLQDNGIGFPQGQAEAIFKTFTRLNARDKYEGTGLGLALCKKIVERHGGSIRAESGEGAGARFIVTLPVKSQ